VIRTLRIRPDRRFIRNRLTALSEQHPSQNGWFLREGFVYDRSSGEFGRLKNFHLQCGTSHIIARSLFALPADLNPRASREAILASVPQDYLLRILGSHRWIADRLAEAGTPLTPLPFTGAVYHIGHGENHTAVSGALRVRSASLSDQVREEFRIPLDLFDNKNQPSPYC
jgi:hypothetical protein